MTSIATNPYATPTNPLISTDSRQSAHRTSADIGSSNPASRVTLSPAAQAALGVKNTSAVVADARHDITTLLAGTGKTSLLEDGELAVDLSSLDRRALFAISSNIGNVFSEDEQKAAALEQHRRFDTTFSGPASVVKITGDYRAIYDLAADYLDAAGTEEKASTPFQQKMNAVKQALIQLTADPERAPHGIANDPVADYFDRAATGDVAKERDFSALTKDVRSILDNLSKNAKGKGLDLSRFNGRSLAAIALNGDDTFGNGEIHAARAEMNARISTNVAEAFQQSSSSNDPTAFSKNLIAQYQSLSLEEREAAGFSPNYLDTLIANYETSSKIAQMFSGMGVSNGASGASGALSLLNFL